jgi:hypothetical protein
VESKWKNYHIITFPGQSLSKNRETQFGRDHGLVARQKKYKINKKSPVLASTENSRLNNSS